MAICLSDRQKFDELMDTLYSPVQLITHFSSSTFGFSGVYSLFGNMPATAGRVRMPANNRVHSSAALQTHGIWQSAIGYDPYAPNKDEKKNNSAQVNSASEPDQENAYASFQGLLALARITGSNADEARGSCRKCGRRHKRRSRRATSESASGSDEGLVRRDKKQSEKKYRKHHHE
ncbi:CAX-interacting protein 4-like protein [Forsythia ovata]|uniref:CAX-interacting protein 4-like protein n=1 Tax=Forsythia ovata TaxID=205694 RepID=A0ABD1T6K8_9LAMI